MAALTFSHIGITVPDLERLLIFTLRHSSVRHYGTYRDPPRRKRNRSNV